MFSLAKIDRKCKGVLSLRLRQCHSCQEPILCTLMHESRFSDPDTFFFLISPSSPKLLGMVSPELRRHWATIARLGVIVAITVEDYYAQGEAVLTAAPRKNVKEHEMLRLYPAGVY